MKLTKEQIKLTPREILEPTVCNNYRDMFVALSVCAADNDTEIVVHNANGEVDYVIDIGTVKYLKQAMRKLLKNGR